MKTVIEYKYICEHSLTSFISLDFTSSSHSNSRDFSVRRVKKLQIYVDRLRRDRPLRTSHNLFDFENKCMKQSISWTWAIEVDIVIQS